ncbi:hypothetical protein HMPREF2943_03065 [Corynebacterium sp. HMSC072D12]|nr:hypothetical protein HMPREF2943_03065 [Corynebacterium sp. HMSC072D12]
MIAMAKRIRIKKWNVDGFREIRYSPGVKSLVHEHAQAITDKLPDGYGWSAREGKTRYRGLVFPHTYKARIDNARHNSLLKAMW